MTTAKQKANRERFKKVMAEAKKLRAKNSKLSQAEAVKKAWAISYNKKSNNVGAAKKASAKKVTSAKIKSALALAKKIKAKKGKSISEKHTDTKSHNVNIRVVSGFQEFNNTQVKELQHLTNSLTAAQYNLKRTIDEKKATRDKDNKMYLTRAADRYRDEIAGLKKQITIVKRLIK